MLVKTSKSFIYRKHESDFKIEQEALRAAIRPSSKPTDSKL